MLNLYKLHSNPKLLKYYDIADEKIPAIFWEKYKNNFTELKKREPAIAKDAMYAYWYAEDVLQKPFLAGEPAIAKDADYANWYKQFLQKINKNA